MSNTALLVDCLKIINWLEDRKKLRKDWYDYLKAGEEKLKVLIKDRQWTINYPEIHSYINQHQHNFTYSDIANVVELLLKTDLAEQKNLLFGYSDQRVKEWTNLKKYMDKNTLMLLSLAKFIQQSLRFDLPGLNKSIQSYDTQLSTLKRKIDFNNNTIFQQSKELAKERSALGIEIKQDQKISIEKLIQTLVERAPEQIKKFQEATRSESMKKYLKLYNQINIKNQTPNILITLQFFIDRGDQFLEVYRDPTKSQTFSTVKKYKEFQHWKGSNEWEIQIQGQYHQEEINIDYTTVIQHRQFRQRLMYELNQLMFFFKGLKQELLTSDKGLGIDNHNSQSGQLVEGEVSEAINQLEKVISFLISKRLTGPLELKNSKKVYQLLVSQFMGYEANITTMENQIRNYKEQIIELEQKRQKEVEKLNWLRRKVAGCKGKCQEWLCELIKRDVKITGEINKLE